MRILTIGRGWFVSAIRYRDGLTEGYAIWEPSVCGERWSIFLLPVEGLFVTNSRLDHEQATMVQDRHQATYARAASLIRHMPYPFTGMVVHVPIRLFRQPRGPPRQMPMGRRPCRRYPHDANRGGQTLGYSSSSGRSLLAASAATCSMSDVVWDGRSCTRSGKWRRFRPRRGKRVCFISPRTPSAIASSIVPVADTRSDDRAMPVHRNQGRASTCRAPATTCRQLGGTVNLAAQTPVTRGSKGVDSKARMLTINGQAAWVRWHSAACGRLPVSLIWVAMGPAT